MYMQTKVFANVTDLQKSYISVTGHNHSINQ